MTPTTELEQRRQRAVHRAVTRALAHPTDAAVALITQLRILPESHFDTTDADIDASRYRLDGVKADTPDGLKQMLQDRYGLTEDDAEKEFRTARRKSGPFSHH